MQLTAVNAYPRSKRQRTGIDNDRLFGIVQHPTEFHHLLIRNEGYGAYASRPFASYVYHETFDIRKMNDLLPTQDIGATDEYNGTEDDPVYLLTLAAWQKTHLFLGGYINLIVLLAFRLTGYALFQLVTA